MLCVIWWIGPRPSSSAANSCPSFCAKAIAAARPMPVNAPVIKTTPSLQRFKPFCARKSTCYGRRNRCLQPRSNGLPNGCLFIKTHRLREQTGWKIRLPPTRVGALPTNAIVCTPIGGLRPVHMHISMEGLPNVKRASMIVLSVLATTLVVWAQSSANLQALQSSDPAVRMQAFYAISQAGTPMDDATRLALIGLLNTETQYLSTLTGKDDFERTWRISRISPALSSTRRTVGECIEFTPDVELASTSLD
jgi:hypothetical protein